MFMIYMHALYNHVDDPHIRECGYEVRTSCEVSPSVTSDGTASISTVEAVCKHK